MLKLVCVLREMIHVNLKASTLAIYFSLNAPYVDPDYEALARTLVKAVPDRCVDIKVVKAKGHTPNEFVNIKEEKDQQGSLHSTLHCHQEHHDRQAPLGI